MLASTIAALAPRKAAAGTRPERAVIAHADHSFRRGLQELGKTVAAWVGSGATAPAVPLRAPGGDAGESEGFREIELSESDGPALDLDEG